MSCKTREYLPGNYASPAVFSLVAYSDALVNPQDTKPSPVRLLQQGPQGRTNDPAAFYVDYWATLTSSLHPYRYLSENGISPQVWYLNYGRKEKQEIQKCRQ